MTSSLRHFVLLAALTGSALSASAMQDDAGASDGGGGLLLLLLIAWLVLGVRKDELVRCPRCRFQAPRREFAGSRCPNCGSCEPAVR